MLRLVAAFSCGAVCAAAVCQAHFYKPRGTQLEAQLSLADAARASSRRDARIEHLERDLVARGAPLDCRHARECHACADCTDAPPGALAGYVPEWARAEGRAAQLSLVDARTALAGETAEVDAARALEWAREKV